jgi:hypothetical protein
MEIFSQSFFRDVSTTSAPLTSLKRNGCYSSREGFVCAVISENELRYSCRTSFQKTIWHTSTHKKFLETGYLCKGKSSGRPPVSDETVELDYRIDICRVTEGSYIVTFVTSSCKRNINVPQNHVSILAKSLINSFHFNIICVNFCYSNPV